MKRNRALPLTITLGSLLIVFTLALTTLWNIVLIYNSLKLKELAGTAEVRQQWVILGVGTFLFVVIITGITLFIVFMSRQIIINQMQKNFIDSVTHELKTPLTSLHLYVETLERHQLVHEKGQRFLKNMLQDIEYLDTLVSHVLEAARTDFRPQDKPLHRVELDTVIAESMDLIQRRYQLEADCIRFQASHLELNTDPYALRLIVVNLLDNAVKYSEGTPSVSIAIKSQAETFEITICDRGLGITPHEQKRIFQRFYRGTPRDTTKGTGLGLFIVKETLKPLKGSIFVNSSGKNQGACFTLVWPQSIVKAAPKTQIE